MSVCACAQPLQQKQGTHNAQKGRRDGQREGGHAQVVEEAGPYLQACPARHSLPAGARLKARGDSATAAAGAREQGGV